MLSKIHLRNVKGVTGSFDLFPNTLIIGPSGTGKSAILSGIKIALTGYTDLGKKAGSTMALASGNEMEVSVESEAGDIISRLFVAKSDGTVTQTIKINGLVVKAAEVASKMPKSLTLPVESIHTHEFTSLSDDKQAEFIFKTLGPELNQIGPESLTHKFSFFKQTMAYSDVLELFAQEVTVTNKEIDRCKATLQKLTGEGSENSFSGTLQEWEQKRSALNAQINEIAGQIAANDEKAKLSSSKNEHIARLQKNIADAEDKIAKGRLKIDDLQSKMVEADAALPSVAVLESEEKKITQRITILTHEISELKKNVAQINTAGVCPCCKTPATNLGDALFDLDILIGDKSELLESAQQDIIALRTKLSLAREYAKNDDVAREVRVEATAIEQYVKTLGTLTAEFHKLNTNSEETPVSSDILKAKQAGLKAQVDEADQAIKSFTANQAIRQQKSQAESQRMKLEESGSALASAVAEIRQIRTEKLSSIQDKLRSSFDKMIDGAMPSCKAFLHLVKNDKPAFDFGFHNANGARVPFAAACGGERTILLAALIACIQTLSDEEPGLCLMELAEADDKTLTAFLSTLPKLGLKQSIAATCHEPNQAIIQLMAASGKIAITELRKPILPENQHFYAEDKAAVAI